MLVAVSLEGLNAHYCIGYVNTVVCSTTLHSGSCIFQTRAEVQVGNLPLSVTAAAEEGKNGLFCHLATPPLHQWYISKVQKILFSTIPNRNINGCTASGGTVHIQIIQNSLHSKTLCCHKSREVFGIHIQNYVETTRPLWTLSLN